MTKISIIYKRLLTNKPRFYFAAVFLVLVSVFIVKYQGEYSDYFTRCFWTGIPTWVAVVTGIIILAGTDALIALQLSRIMNAVENEETAGLITVLVLMSPVGVPYMFNLKSLNGYICLLPFCVFMVFITLLLGKRTQLLSIVPVALFSFFSLVDTELRPIFNQYRLFFEVLTVYGSVLNISGAGNKKTGQKNKPSKKTSRQELYVFIAVFLIISISEILSKVNRIEDNQEMHFSLFSSRMLANYAVVLPVLAVLFYFVIKLSSEIKEFYSDFTLYLIVSLVVIILSVIEKNELIILPFLCLSGSALFYYESVLLPDKVSKWLKKEREWLKNNWWIAFLLLSVNAQFTVIPKYLPDSVLSAALLY